MIYITLLVLLLVFIFYMVFKAHHDTIDYQTIYDEKLPVSFDTYCIFFISDIHRRRIKTSTLLSIKDRIDMINIGGDLTEKGVPIQRTINNIRKLKEIGVPIYFVWGNNDYEALPERLERVLNEEKVTILKDTYEDIIRGNERITLYGFDYYQYNKTHKNIDWEYAKNNYSILLTHSPSSFYALESDKQKSFQMVLAGHTHGGQIRLFGFGFYEKGYLSNHNDTNVLVSEGYGYTMLPFRLETKAECHVITFRSREKEHIRSTNI